MFAQRFQGWKDNNGEKVPLWSTDSELEASITHWNHAHPGANEEDFARSCVNDLRNHLAFLSLWLGLNIKCLTVGSTTTLQIIFILVGIVLTSLAARHLESCLKVIGYHAARRVCNNLKCQQEQSRNLPPYDSIDQVFQFAWLAAINPAKFLRNFEAQMPSLVNYAKSKMKGIIKDKVFGHKYRTITNSRYGLLGELTPGARRKALQRQGYWEPMQSCYALAWECFEQMYTPRQKQLTQRQWEAIANQYYKLQKQLPSSVVNQTINWQTMKEWIDNICITAARNYLDPPSISINNQNQETDSPNIDLPDVSPTPTDVLQQEEMNEIIMHFQAEFRLKEWLQANLDTEKKLIMLMRHGLKLTQSEVAQEFNWYEQKNHKPAYTRILRREDQVRLKLAIEVAKWVRQYTLEKNRNGEEQAESELTFNSQMLEEMGIKQAITQLLNKHYQTLMQSFLNEALLTIDCTSRKCLRLRYVEQKNITAIAVLVQIPLSSISIKLAESQQNLQNSILNQIQTRFNVTFVSSALGLEKIACLVETLLKTATYA